MANSSMRGGRTRKFKSEINVVPYIDVMLVLLVIFMAAAPMVNPSVINLPTAGKSALPPPEYIQISLKPDEAASIGITGGKSAGVADREHLAEDVGPAHRRDGQQQRHHKLHQDRCVGNQVEKRQVCGGGHGIGLSVKRIQSG